MCDQQYVSTCVCHINEVKLRRPRLVLGLVTTFGLSTISVFFRSLRPTQPGHPSVGRSRRCNEEKKLRVLRSSRPCDQDCWHTGWSR